MNIKDSDSQVGALKGYLWQTISEFFYYRHSFIYFQDSSIDMLFETKLFNK